MKKLTTALIGVFFAIFTVSAQYVGIGTDTPDATLTIGDGTNSNAYMHIKRDNDPHIHLFEGTTSVARIQGNIVTYNSVGHPQFQITKANGTSPLFNVNQDDGYVGIGTTSPGARLTIVDGSTNPSTYDDGKALFVSGVFGSGQSADGGFELRHDNLTQGIGFGYNTIYAAGTNTNQELNISAKGSSHLVLQAHNGTTGNVGIGTTNPTQKLDVKGGSIIVRQGNGGGGSDRDQIFFGYNDGTLYRQAIRTQHHSAQGKNSGSPQNTIDFYIWNNSITSDAEPTDKVMSVTNGGVLGRFRHITMSGLWLDNRSGPETQWMSLTQNNREWNNHNWDNHTVTMVPYKGRIVAIFLALDPNSSGGVELSNVRFTFDSGALLNDGCCTNQRYSDNGGSHTVLYNGNTFASGSGNAFNIDDGGKVVWKAGSSTIFSFNEGDEVALGLRIPSGGYIEDNEITLTIVWEYEIWY